MMQHDLNGVERAVDDKAADGAVVSAQGSAMMNAGDTKTPNTTNNRVLNLDGAQVADRVGVTNSAAPKAEPIAVGMKAPSEAGKPAQEEESPHEDGLAIAIASAQNGHLGSPAPTKNIGQEVKEIILELCRLIAGSGGRSDQSDNDDDDQGAARTKQERRESEIKKLEERLSGLLSGLNGKDDRQLRSLIEELIELIGVFRASAKSESPINDLFSLAMQQQKFATMACLMEMASNANASERPVSLALEQFLAAQKISSQTLNTDHQQPDCQTAPQTSPEVSASNPKIEEIKQAIKDKRFDAAYSLLDKQQMKSLKQEDFHVLIDSIGRILCGDDAKYADFFTGGAYRYCMTNGYLTDVGYKLRFAYNQAIEERNLGALKLIRWLHEFGCNVCKFDIGCFELDFVGFWTVGVDVFRGFIKEPNTELLTELIGILNGHTTNQLFNSRRNVDQFAVTVLVRSGSVDAIKMLEENVRAAWRDDMCTAAQCAESGIKSGSVEMLEYLVQLGEDEGKCILTKSSEESYVSLQNVLEHNRTHTVAKMLAFVCKLLTERKWTKQLREQALYSLDHFWVSVNNKEVFNALIEPLSGSKNVQERCYREALKKTEDGGVYMCALGKLEQSALCVAEQNHHKKLKSILRSVARLRTNVTEGMDWVKNTFSTANGDNAQDKSQGKERAEAIKSFFNDRGLIDYILRYGNLDMVKYLFENQKILGIEALLRNVLIGTRGKLMQDVFLSGNLEKVEFLAEQYKKYLPINKKEWPKFDTSAFWYSKAVKAGHYEALLNHCIAIDPTGQLLLLTLGSHYHAAYSIIEFCAERLQKIINGCENKWQLLELVQRVYNTDYYCSCPIPKCFAIQAPEKNRNDERELKRRNFFIEAIDKQSNLQAKFEQLHGEDGIIIRPDETTKRLCLSRQKILVNALVRSHKVWRKQTLLRRAVELKNTGCVKVILNEMQWLANDPAQLKHVLLHQGRHLVMDMIQHTPECLPQLLDLCRQAKDRDMVLRTLLDYGRRGPWWQGARENALLHIIKHGLKRNLHTTQQDGTQPDQNLDSDAVSQSSEQLDPASGIAPQNSKQPDSDLDIAPQESEQPDLDSGTAQQSGEQLDSGSGIAPQDGAQLGSDSGAAPQDNITSAGVIEMLLNHCSDKLLTEWLMRSEKEGNPLIVAVKLGEVDIARAILNRIFKIKVNTPSETNAVADKQATNDGASVTDKAATGTPDAVSEISSNQGGENAANGADSTILQQTNTLWDQIKDKTPRGLGTSLGKWIKEKFAHLSGDGNYRQIFTDNDDKLEEPKNDQNDEHTELELDNLDKEFDEDDDAHLGLNG